MEYKKLAKKNIKYYHLIEQIGKGATGKVWLAVDERKNELLAIKAIPNEYLKKEEGKTRIIEYYNSQCDFFITDARSQAAMENYDEALYMLLSIPNVCKDCYMRAQAEIPGMYKNKIDKECASYLTQARSAWMARGSADEARDAAMEASMLLSEINPNAECYDEALSFMKQIGKKMEEIDNREWEFVKRMEDHRHKEALSSINAAKEIEMAWAKNQPKTIYNIRTWW